MHQEIFSVESLPLRFPTGARGSASDLPVPTPPWAPTPASPRPTRSSRSKSGKKTEGQNRKNPLAKPAAQQDNPRIQPKVEKPQAHPKRSPGPVGQPANSLTHHLWFCRVGLFGGNFGSESGLGRWRVEALGPQIHENTQVFLRKNITFWRGAFLKAL